MKVLYFLRDNGGCGWYRCASPLETASANGAIQVCHIEKGDKVEDIGQKLAWAELCVIPRVYDEKFYGVLKTLKEMGKKVVVDWDDNIWKISPLSPHYRDHGTENYSHEYKGEMLPVWEDGKSIDLAKNRAGLLRAKEAMGLADMVTTTTNIIADEFRQFNPNVKVLPNCIDLTLWKKLPLQPHKGIRMGWSGGYSHYEDWLIMAQVLPQFMRDNPNVTLVILGHKWDSSLRGIDPSRIDYRGWCPTPAYPYVSAIMDLDFAVIPLVDNEFNRCKSPIKWLEMAALEVPSVSSFCSPYAEMMDLVAENGIFVENNDPSGWLAALETMTARAELRKRMGVAARQTVERHFDVAKNYHLWVEAYESLKAPVLEVA